MLDVERYNNLLLDTGDSTHHHILEVEDKIEEDNYYPSLSYSYSNVT